MTHNRSTGNTAGLIVDVIDDRQVLIAAHNSVTHNFISDNNRPNSGAGSETEDLVPGIGVVHQAPFVPVPSAHGSATPALQSLAAAVRMTICTSFDGRRVRLCTHGEGLATFSVGLRQFRTTAPLRLIWIEPAAIDSGAMLTS